MPFATFVATCFIFPICTVAHELGHAITARALGLKIAAMEFGSGRKIWSVLVGEIPVRLNLIPLGGHTYLGADDVQGLRWRFWVTIAMGPAVNLGMAAITLALWDPIVVRLGSTWPALWIISNFLMGVGNLLPYRTAALGPETRSDGLALLQVPRESREKIAKLRAGFPAARAVLGYADRDFRRACQYCEEALHRDAHIVELRVIWSASLARLGDFAGGERAIRPALDALQDQKPVIRAFIRNNLAACALLARPPTSTESAGLSELDCLSASAFEAFPCILEFRSTRAMVLVAMNRSDEALSLLEYVHYDSADNYAKGDREVARAFAYRAQGSANESQAAIERALSLHGGTDAVTRALGLAASMVA